MLNVLEHPKMDLNISSDSAIEDQIAEDLLPKTRRKRKVLISYVMEFKYLNLGQTILVNIILFDDNMHTKGKL